jgi:sulfite reductase (NADPH) flavoprotein alpha-component
MQQLTREKLVLFVVATFGHNQPPYSGAQLKAFVNKKDTKLPNLTYSVLALGNSVYPSFCSFGKLFDKRLEEVGAQRLMPVTLCDEVRCEIDLGVVIIQELGHLILEK